MDIKINVTGSNISGGFNALNRSKIGGTVENVSVDVVDSEIENGFSLLEDTEINVVETDIKSAMKNLDKNSAEYTELCSIFRLENKRRRRAKLLQHIQSFAEGVAASIVAGYISGRK